MKIYKQLEQGSDAWLAARCGMLTASEMKNIITPTTLKYASNDKERSHLYELAAQRITGHVEPAYISDDMLRGMEDEITCRYLYEKHVAPVEQVGFITNDKWGFTLGYSPDGLVGERGLIECKSRRQKYQVETIIVEEIPPEYMLQMQTGMLVSERDWCDYLSFSAGLPMIPLRVYANDKMQAAILDAAEAFEKKLADKLERYRERLEMNKSKAIATERKQPEQEMMI